MLPLTLVILLAAAAEGPEAEVRALLDRQVADWNRQDLDGFCEGYWRSDSLVFLSGGEKTKGWQAMRDRYRARYRGEGKQMGKLTFGDVEVEALGDDSALARGRWDLEFAPGGKQAEGRAGGRFTLVLRKKPEGWKIIHDHTSSDAPASEKPGPTPRERDCGPDPRPSNS